MTFGLVAGLAANALWALAFLAPYLTAPLANVDFAFLRFFLSGTLSTVLIVFLLGKGVQLPSRVAGRALVLGAVGYAFSFLCTASAVRLAGGVIAALVIGLVPVVFSIGANLARKTLPWPPLILSAALVMAGLALLRLDEAPGVIPNTGLATLLGLLAAIAAMLSWGYFITFNRDDEPGAERDRHRPLLRVAWIGMGALAGGTLLELGAYLIGVSRFPLVWQTPMATLPAVTLAAFMGLFSTWAATWLWGRCSARLPAAACAQLGASETVFAVAYALLWETRLPGALTMTGTALVVGGLTLTLGRSSLPR